jgi:hypothetical protein
MAPFAPLPKQRSRPGRCTSGGSNYLAPFRRAFDETVMHRASPPLCSATAGGSEDALQPRARLRSIVGRVPAFSRSHSGWDAR